MGVLEVPMSLSRELSTGLEGSPGLAIFVSLGIFLSQQMMCFVRAGEQNLLTRARFLGCNSILRFLSFAVVYHHAVCLQCYTYNNADEIAAWIYTLLYNFQGFAGS